MSHSTVPPITFPSRHFSLRLFRVSSKVIFSLHVLLPFEAKFPSSDFSLYSLPSQITTPQPPPPPPPRYIFLLHFLPLRKRCSLLFFTKQTFVKPLVSIVFDIFLGVADFFMEMGLFQGKNIKLYFKNGDTIPAAVVFNV